MNFHNTKLYDNEGLISTFYKKKKKKKLILPTVVCIYLSLLAQWPKKTLTCANSVDPDNEPSHQNLHYLPLY